jgi:hypothetical protein
MKPRKLPDAVRERIEQTARIQATLPTDKELAHQGGISLTWVQVIKREVRLKLAQERQDTQAVT